MKWRLAGKTQKERGESITLVTFWPPWIWMNLRLNGWKPMPNYMRYGTTLLTELESKEHVPLWLVNAFSLNSVNRCVLPSLTGWLLIRGVCIGCRFDADDVEVLLDTNSRVVPLCWCCCCCRICLLGDEGLWSGETLPSLSLAVDEGGVGGSVNPRHIRQCMTPVNDYNVRIMDKMRIFKKVLELKFKGRRPMGRPKRRGRMRRNQVVVGFKNNCQTKNCPTYSCGSN